MTSASSAAARSETVGQRVVKAWKYGVACGTVVCCSMTSDNQTRYGSVRGAPTAARHGRLRAWASYQASSRERIRSMSGETSGIGRAI